jgi:hypothetical protein
MNKNYLDLCQPIWITENPELFYGFWGKCWNDYRDTIPHEGYNIMKKWKNNMFGSSNPTYAAFRESLMNFEDVYNPESSNTGVTPEDALYIPGNCFVYTSNVRIGSFE